MSRKLLLPLMLVVMLALMSISAAAAQESGLTLVSTEYIEGKGLVLKFEGAENLDPLPKEGEIVIGEHHYAMNCKLDDDDVLVCVAWLPKKHYGDYAGIYLDDFFHEVLVVPPRPKPEPVYIPPPEMPSEEEV